MQLNLRELKYLENLVRKDYDSNLNTIKDESKANKQMEILVKISLKIDEKQQKRR